MISLGATNACSSGGFGALTECPPHDGTPLGIIITGHDLGGQHLEPFRSDSVANCFTSLTAAMQSDYEYITVGDVGYEQGMIAPITVLEGLTALAQSGGEPRELAEGFGDPIVDGANPETDVFTFNLGGRCFYKGLAGLHGKLVRVFFIDRDYRVTGTLSTPIIDSATPRYILKGFGAYIGVQYRKNDGTNTPATILTLKYTKDYHEELRSSVTYPIAPVVIPKVLKRGVEFRTSGTSTVTTSTFSITLKVFMSCTESDITDLFAMMGSMFVSVTTEDGRFGSVSSVTVTSDTVTIAGSTPGSRMSELFFPLDAVIPPALATVLTNYRLRLPRTIIKRNL